MAEPVADAPGFEFKKIGLLGGGRMAEAILAGVVKEELLPDPSKIVVFDVNRERVDYLRKTFGVSVASSIPAVCNTDLTVICVKPQNLPGVWCVRTVQWPQVQVAHGLPPFSKPFHPHT